MSLGQKPRSAPHASILLLVLNRLQHVEFEDRRDAMRARFLGLLYFKLGGVLAGCGVNLNWVFDPAHCLRLRARGIAALARRWGVERTPPRS